MKKKSAILIQTQLFQCHREERSDVAISLIHLKRLSRPFRARNDIVKIYIAFILINKNTLFSFLILSYMKESIKNYIHQYRKRVS